MIKTYDEIKAEAQAISGAEGKGSITKGMVGGTIEDLADYAHSVAPAFNGFPIQKRGDTLKILSIGNSFVQQPISILRAAQGLLEGKNVKWCICLNGGWSLEQYYNGIDGDYKYSFIEQSADNDYAVKYLNLITGEDITEDSNHKVNTLKDCIMADDWDVVTFQQASQYSGKYDTVLPYLNKLILFVRYWCSNRSCKVIWQQTWASASDCEERLKYYNNSQEEMWNGIAEVAKNVIKDSNLDCIVASGSLLQKMRANKDLFSNSYRDFCTDDGIHLSPIGNYAVCVLFIQTIVNAVYGGTMRGVDVDYVPFAGYTLPKRDRDLAITFALNASADIFNEYDCIVEKEEEDPHEYVDLGLPSGTLWATCNVGATQPEDIGDYFAWGETEPYYTDGHNYDSPCSNWKSGKTGHNWESYKLCDGTNVTQAKYCTSTEYGTVDNKTVLEAADDAAAANWGKNWRMPTLTEWVELKNSCTWVYTTINGVKCDKVTGPNGNYIILPATGYRTNQTLTDKSTGGYYWTSTLSSTQSDKARNIGFGATSQPTSQSDRCMGRCVRAVKI